MVWFLIIILVVYCFTSNWIGIFPLSNNSIVSKETCEFPKINPWDPTILQYIKKPSSIVCSEDQPYLTYVDNNGILQFNKTEVSSLINENIIDIICYYQTFDRDPTSSDVNAIKYDTKVKFILSVKLEKDFVVVECSTKNSPKFYFNIHTNRASKSSAKNFSKPSDTQLSVLLMTIDGLSYSLFKRSMPLTNEYVTKTMGMIMMESTV